MYFLPICCLLLDRHLPLAAYLYGQNACCQYQSLLDLTRRANDAEVLSAGPEDAYLRVMERVARIELAPTAWKAEVLPLNYTRVFSNPLIHRVSTHPRGSALLLSRLLFALRSSLQDSFSNILTFFTCSTCFALTGVAPNGLSVLNGGGGRIRTTEAFASDLQSDPFDRSGTPPFLRR